MQTKEIVLATCGNAGVEDALADVDIQSALRPLLDGQIYECIFPTATMGFEQIAQKLDDLHMETGRKIVVVRHSLSG